MKPSKVFTLSERRQIYQDMLIYLQTPGLKRACFCLMLSGNLMKSKAMIPKTLLWIDILPVHIIKLFPELLKFKPEPAPRYNTYWFLTSDFQSRIAILSQILARFSPAKTPPI